MKNKGQSDKMFAVFVAIGVIALISVFALYPIYNVWSRGLSGEAQLREAEWNRQIAIEEARAEKESATLKKEADIIRAEGVAEANKIIAESLTPEYIRWKWVEGLQSENVETIYVPTEAGIPIMEATR